MNLRAKVEAAVKRLQDYRMSLAEAKEALKLAKEKDERQTRELSTQANLIKRLTRQVRSFGGSPEV